MTEMVAYDLFNQAYTEEAAGSGVIIDEAGYIITNNHVVEDAQDIQVELYDGTTYSASIVGVDTLTDLAVIRADAPDLPYAPLGDSEDLAVGEWVVAIGNALGEGISATQGIVSRLDVSLAVGGTTLRDLIQTTAAINPGNSGGPLINLSGQVIGVNAAIATESGGFEGIGFAIPSNMAVHVAKALIDHGKVIRGWLGVSIRDLTPQQVKSMQRKDNKGALIADVVPDSPAAKAGLKKGDLVVRFHGDPIQDAAALQRRVGDTPVGDTAELTVSRDGKFIDLTVTVGSMEDAVRRIAASLEDRLGAVIRPLKESEIRQYGIDAGQGIAIASLDHGGPLDTVGFEKDDVILDVNNLPVKSVEGFVAMIKSLPPHQQVLFKALDHRTGQTGFVQVTIG